MQKQRLDPAAAARWLADRLKRDQREAPAGQARGAFSKGPRAYVTCAPCTRMFGYIRKDGAPAVIGVSKQHARRHAQDHKLGRIKPVRVPA